MSFSKIKRQLEYILSLPKSFYVSWRLTSFKRAWELPVLCRFNCKVLGVKGKLEGGGRMRIGFYPPGIIDKHQRCLLNLAGNIRINGNVTIGAGSRIEVAQKAVLEFLGIVDNSAAVSIECQDRITIGGGTVISWDVLIMDDDFHFIQDIETGLTNKRHKPIVIGYNTWICCGCKILKGAVLPDGCILSAGSVLSKRFEEKYCLLQGVPAMLVKRGVTRSDVEKLRN